MQSTQSVRVIRSIIALGLLVGMVVLLWFIGTNPLRIYACTASRAAYAPYPATQAEQERYKNLASLLACKPGKVIAQNAIQLVSEGNPDAVKLNGYLVEEVDLPGPTDFTEFRLGTAPLKKIWRLTVTGGPFGQYTGDDYRPWTMSLGGTSLDCMSHTVLRSFEAQCTNTYHYGTRDTLISVLPNASLLHEGVTLAVNGPYPLQAYEPIILHFSQPPTE